MVAMLSDIPMSHACIHPHPQAASPQLAHPRSQGAVQRRRRQGRQGRARRPRAARSARRGTGRAATRRAELPRRESTRTRRWVAGLDFGLSSWFCPTVPVPAVSPPVVWLWRTGLLHKVHTSPANSLNPLLSTGRLHQLRPPHRPPSKTRPSHSTAQPPQHIYAGRTLHRWRRRSA